MRLALIATAAVLLGAADMGAQETLGSPARDTVRPTAADLTDFLTAASASWSYVERQYQPATGLVNSVAGYTYATVWDIGSGLAALYCAHELGLLPRDDYDRRMGRALATLRRAPLFQSTAFNKNYSTRSGGAAGRNDREAGMGHGWSATDLGRLLIWLKIVSVNHPRFAPDVQHVIDRLRLSELVRDGYLWGASQNRGGKVQRYPEGRLPYEQYAAIGFALWGKRAERALSFSENALPIEVMEVPLVADRRGHDHLTSEPLVLMGLEVGWTPEAAGLARNLLRVQEERHRRTGIVTIVSEDAIPKAPHFFFYYTVNYHGDQFAIATQNSDRALDEPRWVSAKAAYGWHALLPSPYTRMAVEVVAPARQAGRGWSSGVYERTGRPTGSENINTAAVILQAALYHQRGRPFLEAPLERQGPPEHSATPDPGIPQLTHGD